LASSRDTSNGPDWQDIQSVIADLQSSLDCRITVEMVLVQDKKVPRLRWTLTAYPYQSEPTEARRSVSLSVPCLASGAQMGVASIYRGLLALDYEASRVWSTKQPITA